MNVYTDMITGCLEFNIETEDRLLQRLAYMFATVAMSSGNYKKHTKSQDIVDGMYSPLIQQITDEPDKPVRPQLSQDEAADFVASMQSQMNKN